MTLNNREKRLDEITKMMAQPDFWEKNSSNQAIQKERASIIDALSPWKNEQKELEEMEILLQLLEEQEDEKETQELLEKVQKTEEAIKQMEFRRMLGGENDPNNAIVSINAGSGWNRGSGLDRNAAPNVSEVG